jgi:glycerol kinase
MYARGCIVGLTRGTKRYHIIRAAQESIAYQSLDLVRAMEKDTGLRLAELKVDGGACRDRFLMQFQADIMGGLIKRPRIRETTALGAAYLAGLAVGFWKDSAELMGRWNCEASFSPAMDGARREALLAGWHRAVGRSRAWAE